MTRNAPLLAGGTANVQPDRGYGQRSFSEPQCRMEAFQEQKEKGAEHEGKRNDLKDSTLPGEHE